MIQHQLAAVCTPAVLDSLAPPALNATDEFQPHGPSLLSSDAHSGQNDDRMLVVFRMLVLDVEDNQVDMPQCQTAADTSAISQLVLAERESRDMGLWTRMRSCFTPDARVRLSWFDGTSEDFVAGSIEMAARGMKAKHRLGPPAIRLNGDRAVASLSAIIDIPATVDGVEVQLSSHARFLFRTQRRNDRWRIAFFDAIYLRDELVAALPGDIVPVSSADLAAFRTSYRMLCFLLSRTGYTPSQDLAGDDRPDTVAALTDEVYGWADLIADAPEG